MPNYTDGQKGCCCRWWWLWISNVGFETVCDDIWCCRWAASAMDDDCGLSMMDLRHSVMWSHAVNVVNFAARCFRWYDALLTAMLRYYLMMDKNYSCRNWWWLMMDLRHLVMRFDVVDVHILSFSWRLEAFDDIMMLCWLWWDIFWSTDTLLLIVLDDIAHGLMTLSRCQ